MEKKRSKKELELYIHIPFCMQKCKYCDFLSASAGRDVQDAYMEALCKEIAEKSMDYKAYRVVTVFIGGGTPSVVNPEWIIRVMGLVRQSFELDENAEITMEMNPGTVTRQSLELYKAAGINRLSMGLQSAHNDELKMLGRVHTYEQFVESFWQAREAGFDNINVDIMSALPGQTLDSYKETLERITGLTFPPEHISAYSLIVEEGTPFYEAYEKGELNLPDEDTERQMYEFTGMFLMEKGYERYEISNYAKQGRECKHNIGYWERKEYLGLGIGAASLVNNSRFSNTSDRDAYIENPSNAFEEVHSLSVREQMEETMFLGLRMTKGVSLERFEKHFGISMSQVYGEVIHKHISNGLLMELSEEGQRSVALTLKGMDVSNYVMADFLEPANF